MSPVRAVLLIVALLASASAAAFDHDHKVWGQLLAKHVLIRDAARASQVRYAGFKRDRPELASYLASLSAVSAGEFDGWSKPQQLAFLINAYNAYTIEKILTRYPDIASIRDFGLIFGNPWKDRFFKLLGRPTHLDNIEHDTIRAEGRFEDPRVHFALNCASVGCPMLREEPYVAARLESQLADQTRRFLGDRSRNRIDAASGSLQVSRIFDWYGGDFTRGWKGYRSLGQFFADYADSLSDDADGRRQLREQRLRIEFLDYDWRLNSAEN